MEAVRDSDKDYKSINPKQFDKIDSADEYSNSGSDVSLDDDDIESSDDDSTRIATKRTYKVLKTIYKRLKSRGRSSSSDDESPLANRRKRASTASTDEDSPLGDDRKRSSFEEDTSLKNQRKISSEDCPRGDRKKRSSEEEDSPLQNRRKKASTNEDSDSSIAKKSKTISPPKDLLDVKASRRYSVRRKSYQSSRKIKDNDNLNHRENPQYEREYRDKHWNDIEENKRWPEKPRGDDRAATQRKYKVLLKTPTAKERQDWSRDFRSKFLGDYGKDRDAFDQGRRPFHDDDDKLQGKSRDHGEDVRRSSRHHGQDVGRSSRHSNEDRERYSQGKSRGYGEDGERYSQGKSRGYSEDGERYSQGKSLGHSEDVERHSKGKSYGHSEDLEKYSTVEKGSQENWYRSQGQSQRLKIRPCSFFNNLGSCRLKSGHKSKSGGTCILHICKSCFYKERAKRYHAEIDCPHK